MNAPLVAERDDLLDRHFPLDGLPIVIGRGFEVDVRLNDRWVSRRNCEIFFRDGAIHVRDLSSSNGTLLNDVHITEAQLRCGDKLTVGLSTFVISCAEDRARLLPTGSTLAKNAEFLERSDGTLIRKNRRPK